jgi:hypothetical protein
VCPNPQSSGAINISLTLLIADNPYFYKSRFLRQRMKKGKIFSILVFLAVVLLAQSCSTSKGCGCGSDINRVYKAKRYH